MPILLIILLAILIAQFGFWDTLQGVFGALGMIILMLAVLAGAAFVAAKVFFRRLRGRF
ncbi:hypothetical protein [Azospirillum sp. SYSU D00513]|uniref:hypothetical protein n=1 Tax=Azospirillum sp. SYSU D00513 TaxID=2812561 RepID=UPI001A95C626|nr:hypothetical protein [Azospirillum sp. SYSU D00513]